MYVPSHFAMPPSDVAAVLASHGAADLVTVTPDGLVASFLPFVHVPAAGPGLGVLDGHLARNNPQWSAGCAGEALVIVHGPDAYVSPSWYPSTAAHGRTVPTWNYVTLHVYGELVVHDDPEWTLDVVSRLTAKHEAGFARPWSAADAPASFIAGQLRAIVGVSLSITRIEAKAKLSQNRSAEDVAGVIEGLRSRGDDANADAVQRAAG